MWFVKNVINLRIENFFFKALNIPMINNDVSSPFNFEKFEAGDRLVLRSLEC